MIFTLLISLDIVSLASCYPQRPKKHFFPHLCFNALSQIVVCLLAGFVMQKKATLYIRVGTLPYQKSTVCTPDNGMSTTHCVPKG